MKITRKEVIALYQTLNGIVNKGNAKFKYAILKNLKIIDTDIESLKVIEKEIEEILKPLIEKRNEVISKYGVKNEDNTISISKENENYIIATKEIEDLSVEFEEEIKLQTEKQTEYMSLLEEEYKIDFKVFEINIDNLPEDLGEKELKVLMDFEIIK